MNLEKFKTNLEILSKELNEELSVIVDSMFNSTTSHALLLVSKEFSITSVKLTIKCDLNYISCSINPAAGGQTYHIHQPHKNPSKIYYTSWKHIALKLEERFISEGYSVETNEIEFKSNESFGHLWISGW